MPASRRSPSHRPGMARLLALVDAGAVDTVIIAKLDRLTRSVVDLAELLKRFERRGVSLVSVADSLDTRSAAGRLVLNIMVSVSQWEREAIGERTRDAMRHKRAKGERVGTVPFGSHVAADGVQLEADVARARSAGADAAAAGGGPAPCDGSRRPSTPMASARAGGRLGGFSMWRPPYEPRGGPPRSPKLAQRRNRVSSVHLSTIPPALSYPRGAVPAWNIGLREVTIRRPRPKSSKHNGVYRYNAAHHRPGNSHCATDRYLPRLSPGHPPP